MINQIYANGKALPTGKQTEQEVIDAVRAQHYGYFVAGYISLFNTKTGKETLVENIPNYVLPGRKKK